MLHCASDAHGVKVVIVIRYPTYKHSFQDADPTDEVQFPGMPFVKSVVVTVTRSNSYRPMKIQVSIKACEKEVETTTMYPSTTTTAGTTTPYTTTGDLIVHYWNSRYNSKYCLKSQYECFTA